jgi:hypothetical protein
VLTYAPGNGATATLQGVVSISNISISSVRPNTTSVIAVKWTDTATSLMGAKGIFQSNLTGYMYSTSALTSSWYNVTLSLPGTSLTFFWQEWVNDSLKNVGTTDIESFTVTNGPPPVYQISLGTLNSTSTGTDGISTNLITYILHPSQDVTYYKVDILGRRQAERVSLLSSEPLSATVSRSIVVAVIYIFIFNLIAWYALKRAEVAE